MGNNVSQVEKDLASDRLPPDERFFGLVNFGNTCYCNSVLQALYFCKPFRDRVLQYRLTNKQKLHETLLSCLSELYFNIASQKKRVGSIAPKKFVARLRKETDIFDSYMHHDAHEFLIFLLDRAADILQAEAREAASSATPSTITSSNGSVPASDRSLSLGAATDSSSISNGPTLTSMNHDEFLRFTTMKNATLATAVAAASVNTTTNGAVNGGGGGSSSSGSTSSGSTSAGNHRNHHANSAGIVTTVASESFNNNNNYSNQPLTWIHDIFQGITRNETRCLNCESVSSMDETFLHLSVEIDQNQSLSACLRQFSSSETLCGECKYYCETCCSKQEAQKCMRVKKLPTILAIHLKRFNRYNNKLSYRVAFPLDLRLYNTSVDCLNAEVTYKLVAVIVHCGQSLNRGHYITIVKSTCKGQWLLFDDEHVEQFDPASFEDFFGLTCDSPKGSETGYILFYDAQ